MILYDNMTTFAYYKIIITNKYMFGISFTSLIGGTSGENDPDGRLTSVSTQMRQASVFALCVTTWEGPPQSSFTTYVDDFYTRYMQPLATDDGWEYWNEGRHNIPEWQNKFWNGPTGYAELVAVKTKYDPNNVFSGYHQVGSDEASNNNGLGVAMLDTTHCPSACRSRGQGCTNIPPQLGLCAPLPSYRNAPGSAGAGALTRQCTDCDHTLTIVMQDDGVWNSDIGWWLQMLPRDGSSQCEPQSGQPEIISSGKGAGTRTIGGLCANADYQIATYFTGDESTGVPCCTQGGFQISIDDSMIYGGIDYESIHTFTLPADISSCPALELTSDGCPANSCTNTRQTTYTSTVELDDDIQPKNHYTSIIRSTVSPSHQTQMTGSFDRSATSLSSRDSASVPSNAATSRHDTLFASAIRDILQDSPASMKMHLMQSVHAIAPLLATRLSTNMYYNICTLVEAINTFSTDRGMSAVIYTAALDDACMQETHVDRLGPRDMQYVVQPPMSYPDMNVTSSVESSFRGIGARSRHDLAWSQYREIDESIAMDLFRLADADHNSLLDMDEMTRSIDILDSVLDEMLVTQSMSRDDIVSSSTRREVIGAGLKTYQREASSGSLCSLPSVSFTVRCTTSCDTDNDGPSPSPTLSPSPPSNFT